MGSIGLVILVANGLYNMFRTAKKWNSLPAYVFPESYDLSIVKARVNRQY